MQTLIRACSGFVSVQSHKFRQFLWFVAGRAVPPGGTAAAAPGLLRLCWLEVRVVYTTLQDTNHNFAHFLEGFLSVTPCCLCCFDLGTLEQSRGSVFVRFRS